MSAAEMLDPRTSALSADLQARLRELRYVLFSDEEIVIALLDYIQPNWRMTRQIDPHRARLEKIISAQGDVHIALEIRIGPQSQRKVFRSDDVVSALLSFCRAARIALPMRGNKGLEVMCGRLTLRIAMLHKAPPAVLWDDE